MKRLNFSLINWQVVDGWELNGELFPNEGDHPLPIKERLTEFCGKSRWYRGKKIFTSSQNAVLIQYRVPLRGRGFVVSARYPKNPRRKYNLINYDTSLNFEESRNRKMLERYTSRSRTDIILHF